MPKGEWRGGMGDEQGRTPGPKSSPGGLVE